MDKKHGLKSISAKLLLNFVLLIVVICVSLAFTADLLATSTLQANIDDSMQQIATQAAATASANLNQYYGSLIALTQDTKLYDIEANKDYIKSMMQKVAEKEGHYDMMVSDTNGKAYSLRADNLDITQRDYYQKAVKGISNVSDPLKREGDDTMVITYCVPIKNGKDIIGTITAIRDAKKISDFVGTITYGGKGSAYMISRDTCITVAHTDYSLVTTYDNDLDNVKKNPTLQSLVDLEKKMMNNEKGVGEYTYENDKGEMINKYMAYAPVDGSNWSLAVTAPKSDVMAGITKLEYVTIGISGAFILIGIIIAVIIASGIKKPIKLATEQAEILAQGNFSMEIPERFLNRRDEIGILAKAFGRVTDSMNELLSNVRTAAEQVNTGAKQISDSSMQLSQGATEQASSIEELTASIEEISSQTKLNAENAANANNIAVEAQKNANVGNDQMKNMLKAMDDINTSSSSISKIIKVIDDIAFQTNILALNAAVEAARAGQAGKGFAVVAEEVRNLAAKSANAAKETTELIEGSIRKVNDGTKIASETAEQLKKIVIEVSKVAELVNSISVASNEQASGIAQVNQGIMQVSQVVQENSSTSEESAAASEELSGQAALLEEQISMFKLRDDKNGKKVVKQEIIPAKSSVPEPVKAASDKSNIKISLSDNEFGKY